MELNITSGVCGKQQIEVSKETTAIAFGSGDVEVFATPAMIALMEKTAIIQTSIQTKFTLI